MIKNKIDMDYLKSKCGELGLKYIIHPEKIVLESQFDVWFFKYNEKRKKPFGLYHMNKDNKSHSPYHFQRAYYDLNYLLCSIPHHDKYTLDKNDIHRTRMWQLFEQAKAMG